MKSRLIPDGSGKDQRRQPEPLNVEELLLRAQALEGFAVGDLASQLGFLVPSDNVRSKGFVGQLVERALGADPKAGELPDFPNLGVELKTIPLRSDGKPSESTFICSIHMESADRDEWETSRLHRRLQRVLFLAIDSSKVAPLAQRRFGRAVVWQPSADEWQLLQHDWEDLMGAIGSGRGATSAREKAKSSSFAPRRPMRPFERLYPGPKVFKCHCRWGFTCVLTSLTGFSRPAQFGLNLRRMLI